MFLDIDGVLNRTGFHPGESVGLRSWIEPELARRLCGVIEATDVVKTDSRRTPRTGEAASGSVKSSSLPPGSV